MCLHPDRIWLYLKSLRSFKIQPAVQQYPCEDAEQGHLEEENSDHARLCDADALHGIRFENAG